MRGAVVTVVVAVGLLLTPPATAAAATPEPIINSTKDLKGVWLTRMQGYSDGKPVQWQYRLTVRKADGVAAVAWEEWRDCADHAAACKAGKASGGGWTAPSRVLLSMGRDGRILGVSEAGISILAPGPDGMSATVACMGQQATWVISPPGTTPDETTGAMVWGSQFAVSSMNDQFTYSPIS